jgi:hypothetical protein
MILIVIFCFVTLFNKNVFFQSTTLDFPVIPDGQFSGGCIILNVSHMCSESS